MVHITRVTILIKKSQVHKNGNSSEYFYGHENAVTIVTPQR